MIAAEFYFIYHRHYAVNIFFVDILNIMSDVSVLAA